MMKNFIITFLLFSYLAILPVYSGPYTASDRAENPKRCEVDLLIPATTSEEYNYVVEKYDRRLTSEFPLYAGYVAKNLIPSEYVVGFDFDLSCEDFAKNLLGKWLTLIE